MTDKEKCQYLNNLSYCEKKKKHIVYPVDCFNCKDYSKPQGINENLKILVD